MKPLFSKIALAVMAVAAVPGVALAESDITTGTGTLSASARVDFRITIPKMLYLRVGTGADRTDVQNGANINLIDFNLAAADVGSGTAVAATAASGDQGNGTVTARVIGNNGSITLSSTAAGALSNGSESIAYTQIDTAVAALGTTPTLSHPGFGSSVALTPTAGSVTQRAASWTYSYLNSNVVAAGTYGGVDTNGGRVTYTASMP